MKSALYYDCLFSQKIEVAPFLNLDSIDSMRNSFMNHEISGGSSHVKLRLRQQMVKNMKKPKRPKFGGLEFVHVLIQVDV